MVIAVVVATTIWSARKRDPDTITIGCLLPLTGDAAKWGIPPRNGAQLAIKEINATGGIEGKRLVLAIEDTCVSPRLGCRRSTSSPRKT